jgi:hypothetical protein
MSQQDDGGNNNDVGAFQQKKMGTLKMSGALLEAKKEGLKTTRTSFKNINLSIPVGNKGKDSNHTNQRSTSDEEESHQTAKRSTSSSMGNSEWIRHRVEEEADPFRKYAPSESHINDGLNTLHVAIMYRCS